MRSEQSVLRRAIGIVSVGAAPLLLGLCIATLSNTTEQYAYGTIEIQNASLLSSINADSQLAYFSGGGTGGTSNMGNTTGKSTTGTSNRNGTTGGSGNPNQGGARSTNSGASASNAGGGTGDADKTGSGAGSTRGGDNNPGARGPAGAGGTGPGGSGGVRSTNSPSNPNTNTKSPGTGGNGVQSNGNNTTDPDKQTPGGGSTRGGDTDPANQGAAQARADAVSKAQTQQKTTEKQTALGNLTRSLTQRFSPPSNFQTPATTPTRSITPAKSLTDALKQPYNMGDTAVKAVAEKVATEARIAAAERTEALAKSLTKSATPTSIPSYQSYRTATVQAPANVPEKPDIDDPDYFNKQVAYNDAVGIEKAVAEVRREAEAAIAEGEARRAAISEAMNAPANVPNSMMAAQNAQRAADVAADAKAKAQATQRAADLSNYGEALADQRLREAVDNQAKQDAANEASRTQEAARRQAESTARIAQERADSVSAINQANAEARSLGEIAADGLRSAWNSVFGGTTQVAENAPVKNNVTDIAKTPQDVVQSVSPAERALMAAKTNPNTTTVVGKTTMPSAPADDVQDLTEAAARRAGIAEPSTDVPGTSCAGCGPTYDQALRDLKAPVQSKDPGLTAAQNAQSVQNATAEMTRAEIASRVTNVTTGSVSKAPATTQPSAVDPKSANAQRAADAATQAKAAVQQTSQPSAVDPKTANAQKAAARARSEAVANSAVATETSAQQRSVAERAAVDAKARQAADTSAQQRAQAEANATAQAQQNQSLAQRATAEKAAVDAANTKTTSQTQEAARRQAESDARTATAQADARSVADAKAKAAADAQANASEMARLNQNLAQQRAQKVAAIDKANAEARSLGEIAAQGFADTWSSLKSFVGFGPTTPTTPTAPNTNVTELGKVPAGSTDVTQPSGFPAKDQSQVPQDPTFNAPGYNPNLPSNANLQNTLKDVAAKTAASEFSGPSKTPTGANSTLGDFGSADLSKAVSGQDPSAAKTTQTSSLADRAAPGISVENTSGLSNTRTPVASQPSAVDPKTANAQKAAARSTTVGTEDLRSAAAKEVGINVKQNAEVPSTRTTSQPSAVDPKTANAQSAEQRAKTQAAERVRADAVANAAEMGRLKQNLSQQEAQRTAQAKVTSQTQEAARRQAESDARTATAQADARSVADAKAKAAADAQANASEMARLNQNLAQQRAQKVAAIDKANAEARSLGEIAADGLRSAWNSVFGGTTQVAENSLDMSPFSNISEKTSLPTQPTRVASVLEENRPPVGTNAPTKTMVANPTTVTPVSGPKTRTSLADSLPSTAPAQPERTVIFEGKVKNASGVVENVRVTQAVDGVKYMEKTFVRNGDTYVQSQNTVTGEVTQTKVASGVTTASISTPTAPVNSMMAARDAQRAADAVAQASADAAGTEQDLRESAAREAGIDVKENPDVPSVDPTGTRSVGSVPTKTVETPQDETPADEAEIEKKESTITKMAIDAWNKLSWYVNGTQNRKNEEQRIQNRGGGGNNQQNNGQNNTKPTATTTTNENAPIVEQSWWQKFLSTFAY